MRNNKGQFTKGNSGKPIGATSQKTNEIRASFQLLIENNLNQLQDDLDNLKPKERLEMIISLSSFVIPKLKATELTATVDGSTQFQPIIIDFTE